MKNIICNYKIIIATLFFIGVTACDKTPENADIAPYDITNIDVTGGTWKTYIVANGNEIQIPAPPSIASDTFKRDLAELVTLTNSLDDTKREAIRYWAAGAVYRWHELAREVAANYNVPPKFDPVTGKYLVPDVNNPSAFPKFPFANPPYTARALALLSVAQYDALVTAWNYKTRYNRLSPKSYENGINAAQTSIVSTFPSEDAVVAAASRDILKALFPNEANVWIAKADEQKNSVMWAGKNVRGDVEAGEAIGKAVAAKVLAYAKLDGMGAANAQANVPAQMDSVRARGTTTELWKSLDLPIRPPMLPFYGNVKTWNMTKVEMILGARPTPPPSIGSPAFNAALQEVKDISKNLTAEQFRIANYWADGAGSYTPPGHWDRISGDAIRNAKFNELRAARTMALVNTAVQDAGVSCWDTKYYYYLPRPSQIDNTIKTVTGIPNFPSYTSGHSTFSAAAAGVLGYIFPNEKATFLSKAKEASVSRIYGSIHYRFDCDAGLASGTAIANFSIARGRTDGSPQ